MATTKSGLTECVCVWLDETSGKADGSGKRHWIISHDRIELPRGNADSTDTITALDADDHDEDDAMENGLLEARELGLPLFRNHEQGPAEAVTFPRTITIRDVGCTVVYRLAGTTLTLTETGGCRDGLNGGGCEVVDTMTDEDIADAVRECWVAGCTENMGEEYDAEGNRLRVTVEAA